MSAAEGPAARNGPPPARRAQLALVLAFGLVLAGLGCPAASTDDVTVAAPDFTLDKLGGGVVSLADLRGKTVVVDFWATWCAPCEFQVPALNAFYDAHSHDSDVAVFGLSVDVDGPEAVSEWVDEKGVRYPILLADEDLARRFGALGFPTLYVIAPDGAIGARHVGLVEAEVLEAALADLRR